MVTNIVPSIKWLKNYNAGYLKSDIVSGVTLAAYGIPVSLAYATLAGLPPQYGVYGYMLGGLFYSLLGTSRQLAIGPTSAISLLIGVTIADMANGDTHRWAEIASLTALVFSVLSVLAYLLRLSSIINFISETVLVGFKAGAGLTIALTQLPKLFGVKGGGENFFERLQVLFTQLPDTNVAVMLFGLVAMIILFVGEKFLPGKPVAIVVVIVSILLVSKTQLSDFQFKTVGFIPAGLPDFSLPSLSVKDVDGVIPLALACFLLSYIESVSAARAMAQKNGYEIDARQELLALGAANLGTALGSSYPVAGGLSQSAVNNAAGAKTPFSLIIASITIAICLLLLTDTLSNLPNVILASIVLVAIRGLFDIKELIHFFNFSKREFLVAMIALVGVLLLGILKGVLLAAVATLIILITVVSKPYVAILGRIPGTKRYSDIDRHPDNERIPGVLIIRIEASILYFNADYIREEIMSKIAAGDLQYHTLILDMNSTPRVDLNGLRMIKRLIFDLQSKNITLKIAEARAEVRDALRAEKLEEILGHISRFVSVDDLVNESQIINTQKINAG